MVSHLGYSQRFLALSIVIRAASSRALCAPWNRSASPEKKPIAMTSRVRSLRTPFRPTWIGSLFRARSGNRLISGRLIPSRFAPEWHVKNGIHKSILGRHHGNASLFRHGWLVHEVFALEIAKSKFHYGTKSSLSCDKEDLEAHIRFPYAAISSEQKLNTVLSGNSL